MVAGPEGTGGRGIFDGTQRGPKGGQFRSHTPRAAKKPMEEQNMRKFNDLIDEMATAYCQRANWGLGFYSLRTSEKDEVREGMRRVLGVVSEVTPTPSVKYRSPSKGLPPSGGTPRKIKNRKGK